MTSTEKKLEGAVLSDSFHAATVDELRRTSPLRRVAAVVDQRLLFPHRGRIEVSADALQLGSWRMLRPDDCLSLSMEFIPEYNRFAAGGARGGFPSFGAMRRLGAPLVLDLRTGERILLLIGFTWWSGSTKDADWLSALNEFVGSVDS